MPWTLELLKTYEEKWDWVELSGNSGVRWTEEMLKLYANFFDNPSIEWNWEMYKKYAGWNMALVENPMNPKTQNLWNRLISPFINSSNFNTIVDAAILRRREISIGSEDDY